MHIAKHILGCQLVSISYSDGRLLFNSSTLGAICHYNISCVDDMDTSYGNRFEKDIAARYDITAYATAEGYRDSDISKASLYWLDNSISTNILQSTKRGIIVDCYSSLVTISGLDDGETTAFYN